MYMRSSLPGAKTTRVGSASEPTTRSDLTGRSAPPAKTEPATVDVDRAASERQRTRVMRWFLWGPGGPGVGSDPNQVRRSKFDFRRTRSTVPLDGRVRRRMYWADSDRMAAGTALRRAPDALSTQEFRQNIVGGWTCYKVFVGAVRGRPEN